MHARFLGFFSGFPTHHFPVGIAERLREELAVRDSLVFVSAWPSDMRGMTATPPECMPCLRNAACPLGDTA